MSSSARRVPGGSKQRPGNDDYKGEASDEPHENNEPSGRGTPPGGTSRRETSGHRVLTPSPILIPTNVVPAISISEESDNPLPFPPLSPRRSLSIIFEGSESTQSLVPSNELPHEETVKQEANSESLHVPTPKAKRLYSLPLLSSLAPKLSRSSSSLSKHGVAEKIAYFEGSLRRDKAASTSPRLPSLFPTSLVTSRRHSLPGSLSTNTHDNSNLRRSDTPAARKLHTSLLWYLNVHAGSSPQWVQCKATLRQSEIQATWNIPKAGRACVTLVLTKCTDLKSTPTFSHPAATEDLGSIAWNEANDRNDILTDGVYPFQLIFPDGIERFAANSLRDRLTWVGAIWDVLTSQPFPEEALGPVDTLAAGSIHTVAEFPEDMSTHGPATSTPANSPRRSNGHGRTRSTGDMPLTSATSPGSQFRPNLRRIVSLTSLGSIPRSPRTDSEYITAKDGSSTLSSISTRHRALSLKGLSSLLLGRSSRNDGLSSPKESNLIADDISSLTPSRTPSTSFFSSYERHPSSPLQLDGTSDSPARSLLGVRARKPKPRLSRLGLSALTSYRSLSDGSAAPLLSETDLEAHTPSSASEFAWTRAQLRSPVPQTSTDHRSSSPLYQTAEDAGTADDSSVTNASYVTAFQSFREAPISPVSGGDSIYITASRFTSSDAWMAHLNANSVPSERAVTSPPQLFVQSPQQSSEILSSSVPALTLDKASSLFSIQATAASPSSNADFTTSSPPTTASVTSHAAAEGNPAAVTDGSSIAWAVQDLAILPSPLSSLHLPANILFPEVNSHPELILRETHGAVITSESASAEQNIGMISSVANLSSRILVPSLTVAVDGLPNQGTSPRRQLGPHPRQNKYSDRVKLRLKVVPKRSLATLSNDSLDSSLFLPSRMTSLHNGVLESPTASVSLTPIQASATTTDLASEDHEVEVDTKGSEDTCKDRIDKLLQFVERTRLAHTNAAGDFSEQLSRIEQQLVDLSHIIAVRMRMSPKQSSHRSSPQSTITPPTPRDAQPSPSQSTAFLVEVTPPDILREEITPTSAELGHSLDRPSAETSKNEEGDKPPSTESTSSLHLHLFPDVPSGFVTTLEQEYGDDTSRNSSTIDGNELRGLIDQLGRTLEDLIHRQRVHNEALKALKDHGVILDPSLPSGQEKDGVLSDTSPEVISALLTRLDKLVKRTPLDPSLSVASYETFPRSSVSLSLGNEDAEIHRAQVITVGGSMAIARRCNPARRRAHSHAGIFPSTVDLRLLGEPFQLYARAHSLGRSTTPFGSRNAVRAPVPSISTETGQTNTGEQPTILGDLGTNQESREAFRPIVDDPITRVWHRGRRVRFATPLVLSPPNSALNPRISEREGPLNEIAAILQGVHTQQEASQAQQQDIVRYLGDLHDWLSRDSFDRRAELQNIGQKLDNIQQRLMYEQIPGLLFSAVSMAPVPPIAVSSIHEPSTIWPGQADSPSTIIPPLPRDHPIATATANQTDENRIGDSPSKPAKAVVPPPAIVPLPIQTEPEEPQTLPTILPGETSHTEPRHVNHSVRIPMHDHPSSEGRRYMQPLTVNGGGEAPRAPGIRMLSPSHVSARSSSLPRRTAGPTQAPEVRHDTAHQHDPRSLLEPPGLLPSSHQERSSRPRSLKPLSTAESQTTNGESRYPSHMVSYEPLDPSVNYHRMSDSYRPESDRPRLRSQRPAHVDEHITPRYPATITQVSLSPKLHQDASYTQTDRVSPPRMTRSGSEPLVPPSSHRRRARFRSPPTIEYSDARNGYDLPSWQPEADNHVHPGHYAQHRLPGTRVQRAWSRSPLRQTEPIGEAKPRYLPSSSDHLQNLRHISDGRDRGNVSESSTHRAEEHRSPYPDNHINHVRPSIPTTSQRDPSSSGQHHLSCLDDGINSVDVASKSPLSRNIRHGHADIVNPLRRMESSTSLPAVTPTPITISRPIPVTVASLGGTLPLNLSPQVYQNDALPPTIQHPNDKLRSLTSTWGERRLVGSSMRPIMYNDPKIAQEPQPQRKKVRRVPPPIFDHNENYGQQDAHHEAQTNSLTPNITLERCQRLTKEKTATVVMDVKQAEGVTMSSVGQLLHPSTRDFPVPMVQNSHDSHPLDPVTTTATPDPGLECQRALEESLHRYRLANEELRRDLLESLQSVPFLAPAATSRDPSRAEMALSHCSPSARKSESQVIVPKHPNDINPLAPLQMSSPMKTLDLVQDLSNSDRSKRAQGEQDINLSMSSRSRQPPNGVVQGSSSPNRRSLRPATEGNDDMVAPETGSLEHSPFDARSAKTLADNVVEIKSILQGLREEGRVMHTSLTAPNNYREDLMREREKARRLEEEIQRTKDAIQAIRAEKAMVEENKCLDALASVSQLQVEMRHQLQDISNQMQECKATHRETSQRSTTTESPTQPRVDPMENLIYQLALGHAENRAQRAGQQSAEEAQASIEGGITLLRSQNEAQKLLIKELMGQSILEGRQRQVQLLEAFGDASVERVKHNVNEHVHEFSGAMEQEVRTLLREVGNLREQRRNIQHEIGCLLCFRSKMGPGGEFESSWDPLTGPTCTHFPSPNATQQVRPTIPAFVNTMPQEEPKPPKGPPGNSRIPTSVSHSVFNHKLKAPKQEVPVVVLTADPGVIPIEPNAGASAQPSRPQSRRKPL